MSMSLLKRIGSIVAKGLTIATGVSPVIIREIPGAAGVVSALNDGLGEISKVVTDVEAVAQALGTLNGADKLKAAMPLVLQVVMNSGLLEGKVIIDPALFNDGIKDLTNGVVKILNSIDTVQK